MDVKKIIKTMAKNRGVSMTWLAGKAGITRQALYSRLAHQMRFENFAELVGLMGGTLYVEFDGRAKKLSSFE